jgi:hypothetical protein
MALAKVLAFSLGPPDITGSRPRLSVSLSRSDRSPGIRPLFGRAVAAWG